jgi:Mg/Co/Ni transporter MgtE
MAVRVLGQLFKGFHGEGFAMSYTMADFERDYIKKHFLKLTPQERREILHSLPLRERREVLQSLPVRERREVLQSLPPEDRREVLQSLPPEERLAGLPVETIREYLEQLTADRPAEPRKPRRKR